MRPSVLTCQMPLPDETSRSELGNPLVMGWKAVIGIEGSKLGPRGLLVQKGRRLTCLSQNACCSICTYAALAASGFDIALHNLLATPWVARIAWTGLPCTDYPDQLCGLGS